MNDEAVYRTAPATPGLLKIYISTTDEMYSRQPFAISQCFFDLLGKKKIRGPNVVLQNGHVPLYLYDVDSFS